MSDEPQGQTATAWLHMLGHGRCTATELAEKVGVTRRQMDKLLSSMVDRGHAKRYPNEARKNGTAYGVTPTCKVPQNTFLADVLLAARDRQPPRQSPALTIPKDRMKAAVLPAWKADEGDLRIPKVVAGWTPPKMVCVRTGV